LEMQTRNPNIRIIWFTQKEPNHPVQIRKVLRRFYSYAQNYKAPAGRAGIDVWFR